jgi:transposase-like protein
MPWKECSAVSCREEFVGLAQAERVPMSALCSRFGVSRKTGYKWLRRHGSAHTVNLPAES